MRNKGFPDADKYIGQVNKIHGANTDYQVISNAAAYEFYNTPSQQFPANNPVGHRKHTPITSARQARFFGAEYGRAKGGEAKETTMTRKELRSHLKEWGRKK